ncbi:MAG TPA: NUDIX domain-containing protein [Thermomicrobiales bacterium]
MSETLPPAQDPEELFEVVTTAGAPTGHYKARYAVHRDGDWHRAVHVWIAGKEADGSPYLIFQRRGLRKDTWPGRLDATVGGHVRAGETIEETLRETDEEIGISVKPERLRWLGTRLSANEAESGTRDREVQEVFLLVDDRPLTDYRPNPVELEGLVKLPVAAVLALYSGEADAVEAEVLAAGSVTPRTETIQLTDFVPSVDRYPYRIAIAASLALQGERHVAI